MNSNNPVEQTYYDVQKLIKKAVWKFKQNHDGDLEDFMGQANLIYLLAYNDYKKGKAKFSTWLHLKINHGLLDYLRRNKGRHFDRKFVKTDFTLIADISTDSVTELIDLFKDDERYMVELILDNYNKGRRGLSCEVRNHLKGMGWTPKRIKLTIQNIQTTLIQERCKL